MTATSQPTVAIRLAEVSKAYKHYQRPLDRLKEFVTRKPIGADRTSVENVSFSIAKGEVVAIIGRNGAGKSTLLKMIAGRLAPTRGAVSVTGSIAAILELGTGFQPDLSGRENVVVGGLCLGLTRAEVDREMQNIIDFSELAEVIDMPFRTYSSGMQARLTFATAVTVDPDVLIIDEALSVGDNKFQLKSFNRIREFKQKGKTILLVTHGMGAVTSFCDRAILLDKGRVVADGDPAWVTSVYHHLQFGELDPAMLRQPQTAAPVDEEPNTESVPEAPGVSHEPAIAVAERRSEATTRSRHIGQLATADLFPALNSDSGASNDMARKGYRYGDRRATISGVALLSAADFQRRREVRVGDVCQLVLDVMAHDDEPEIFAGFLIRDPKGDILFGADTSLGLPQGIQLLRHLRTGTRRRIVAEVQIWLAPGIYYLSGAVTAEVGKQSDMWFDAYEFRVVAPSVQHTNSRVFLDPVFNILPLPDNVTDSVQDGK
jgi:lipopolysaccharide transport system ATP-binding protein